MTTYTKIAFEVALDKKFPTNFEFFEYMKQVGFFLDDLSLVPVNKLPSAEREAKLVEEGESFSERVLQMKPEVVVVVLRKIEQIVREALNKVGSTAEVHVLPFPGNGHQNKYKAQLIPIVREHGNRT